MTILITAFDPFGDLSENASQRVLETLDGLAGLVTEVLPTAFSAATERVLGLIDTHQPAAVVCLGVAEKSSALRLERVALNLDDARIPDNHGAQPRGSQIDPAAPPAYWATLPIEDMHAALIAAGVPGEISNHAGTFVCNHVFFAVQHYLTLTAPATPAGFIHVPGIRPADAAADAPGLPLDDIVRGVRACLGVLYGG
ncbi:MAG: pyroglutamyl-peptidase I [Anaerolineales bacterium]